MKALVKLNKLIKAILINRGICYSIVVTTDWDNQFEHSAFSYKEVLEWLRCYPNADSVEVFGFGKLYTLSTRNS